MLGYHDTKPLPLHTTWCENSDIKIRYSFIQLFVRKITMYHENQPPSAQHDPDKWLYLETKMKVSLSQSSFTVHCAAPQYNIQRPFLKDCLWGFFSVNVILLQTSLWKCHLATLFISSPALVSIRHHFPLEGSHTQGEALFELHVLKCDCKTWRDGCSRCSGVLRCVFWFDVCSAVIHLSLKIRRRFPRCVGLSITSVEEESCSFKS